MTSHSQSPSIRQSGTSGVVVVGAGLAGLFTALKLAPLPVTVVRRARISAKERPACGRRRASPPRWPKATRPRRMRPTRSAPAPASSMRRSRILMAREARDRIEDLLRYGVPFDKDLEGHFASAARRRTAETASSTSRATPPAAPSCSAVRGGAAHSVDHRARRLCRSRSRAQRRPRRGCRACRHVA